MIIDASVWIAAAVSDEPDHRHAQTLLELLPSRTIAVHLPEIALIEVACGLARRSGSPEDSLRYAKTIERLKPIYFYPVDQALRDRSIEIGVHYQLRAADAIYLALAQELNLPLITLDREQQARGPKSIQVLSPLEALELII
ncbi:type II toxin-antitoxin system VapC family toxin [Candidatus Berkelbacteria bacterium]|nr:type II toxin-antitoxin system VapC family toxin [Candidatus Berkelbacteria bacterium]